MPKVYGPNARPCKGVGGARQRLLCSALHCRNRCGIPSQVQVAHERPRALCCPNHGPRWYVRVVRVIGANPMWYAAANRLLTEPSSGNGGMDRFSVLKSILDHINVHAQESKSGTRFFLCARINRLLSQGAARHGLHGHDPTPHAPRRRLPPSAPNDPVAPSSNFWRNQSSKLIQQINSIVLFRRASCSMTNCCLEARATSSVCEPCAPRSVSRPLPPGSTMPATSSCNRTFSRLSSASLLRIDPNARSSLVPSGLPLPCRTRS